MIKVVISAVTVSYALVLVLATVGPGDDVPIGSGGVSAVALEEIPPVFFAAYQQAAPTCGGLDWQVLAGIGWVESGHGATAPLASAVTAEVTRA
mgnify:CR=1 FL=1